MTGIDEKFRDVDEVTAEREPAPLPPAPVPIGLQLAAEVPGFNPVTAAGGECSDLGLLPGRFDQFATKTERALATLAEGMKLLNESVLPLVEKLERRQDEDHQALLRLAGRVDVEAKRNDRQDARDDRQDARLDAVEAELAALRKPARKPAATKAQRPKKRAGRKLR